ALLNYRHGSAMTTEDDAATHAWEGMRLLSEQQHTNYPITLSIDDLGQGFALTAECIPGIDPTRINAYLQTAIDALVTALATDPERPVLSLPILSAAERTQLLVAWNDTAVPYPNEALVHRLVEAQVAATPAAVAVVEEGRE